VAHWLRQGAADGFVLTARAPISMAMIPIRKDRSMKCPVDHTELVMTDRNGVEIDYCPSCRGVWLDRGELDKIIDRTRADTAPAVVLSEPGGRATEPSRGRQGGRDRDDDDDDDRRRRPKKRDSFLSDLFDF
jgi:Zn-finger nucleic acid-binding protein